MVEKSSIGDTGAVAGVMLLGDGKKSLGENPRNTVNGMFLSTSIASAFLALVLANFEAQESPRLQVSGADTILIETTHKVAQALQSEVNLASIMEANESDSTISSSILQDRNINQFQLDVISVIRNGGKSTQQKRALLDLIEEHRTEVIAPMMEGLEKMQAIEDFELDPALYNDIRRYQAHVNSVENDLKRLYKENPLIRKLYTNGSIFFALASLILFRMRNPEVGMWDRISGPFKGLFKRKEKPLRPAVRPESEAPAPEPAAEPEAVEAEVVERGGPEKKRFKLPGWLKPWDRKEKPNALEAEVVEQGGFESFDNRD